MAAESIDGHELGRRTESNDLMTELGESLGPSTLLPPSRVCPS